MKLLVGLGNPGPEYADTRHNVGVRVLERFAREHAIVFAGERFASRFGVGPMEADGPEPIEVALLAPQTFMNRSGEAVAAAVAGLPLGDVADSLLVVLDDVDLPFGRLRLRRGGGAGGHRGLADILACLERNDVPRLRFGVGRPPGHSETADHVLAAFSAEEAVALPAALERVAAAAALFFRCGVVAAMNAYNRDPEPDAANPADGC